MPPGITIVGLGPGNPDQITLEAWRVIEGASEVYLRTKRHPSVSALPKGTEYHSFDHLYETLGSFAEVYEEIARAIVALGRRPQGVVYAVPGHPLVGETSVWRILELAKAECFAARVVAGVSFLEPTATALGIDLFGGLQICDAMVLAQRRHPSLNPDVGALIAQVYSRQLAAEIKMTLMNLYHDDHPIRIVRRAGMEEEQVCELPLYALDREDRFDHLTLVYVPPLACPGSMASFQDLVARLRAPGGCPWDREQTHLTLRTYLLEETYEVLAALDADDMEALEEELGDLMLQILWHTQLATEDGDFKLIDMVQHVTEKLIRRHPHVFGDAVAENSRDVLRNWERIKRQERTDDSASMLSGVPQALPALSRALEMQRRAARVGFDWDGVEPVLAKVAEEIDEFHLASKGRDRASELGDLLFSLVNVARWCEIDPESALREANERFARRFAGIESHAREDGVSLEGMTLEEMDALWEEMKREEHS